MNLEGSEQAKNFKEIWNAIAELETVEPYIVILLWGDSPHHEMVLQRRVGNEFWCTGTKMVTLMKSTFQYYLETNQITQPRPHT